MASFSLTQAAQTSLEGSLSADATSWYDAHSGQVQTIVDAASSGNDQLSHAAAAQYGAELGGALGGLVFGPVGGAIGSALGYAIGYVAPAATSYPDVAYASVAIYHHSDLPQRVADAYTAWAQAVRAELAARQLLVDSAASSRRAIAKVVATLAPPITWIDPGYGVALVGEGTHRRAPYLVTDGAQVGYPPDLHGSNHGTWAQWAIDDAVVHAARGDLADVWPGQLRARVARGTAAIAAALHAWDKRHPGPSGLVRGVPIHVTKHPHSGKAALVAGGAAVAALVTALALV